jgi:hypothetical protein
LTGRTKTEKESESETIEEGLTESTKIIHDFMSGILPIRREIRRESC